jgi:hypothetical protein
VARGGIQVGGGEIWPGSGMGSAWRDLAGGGARARGALSRRSSQETAWDRVSSSVVVGLYLTLAHVTSVFFLSSTTVPTIDCSFQATAHQYQHSLSQSAPPF